MKIIAIVLLFSSTVVHAAPFVDAEIKTSMKIDGLYKTEVFSGRALEPEAI